MTTTTITHRDLKTSRAHFVCVWPSPRQEKYRFGVIARTVTVKR